MSISIINANEVISCKGCGKKSGIVENGNKVQKGKVKKEANKKNKKVENASKTDKADKVKKASKVDKAATVIDQDLVQKFALAQELAKYEIRKQKRKEANENVKEDKVDILDIIKINEVWLPFLRELGAEEKFYAGRYKIPYRGTNVGTFVGINWLKGIPNLEYKTYFKAGPIELRSSGRDMNLVMGQVTYSITFLGNKDNVYMAFDAGDDGGMISVIGALCILKNNMTPFYDALAYFYSQKLIIDIGDVDTIGYDDLFIKAHKTLTCRDGRISTRHVLFAGEPGTGKSMLIKKLIKNKPSDVLVVNIDVDHDWEQIIPFLNVLAGGTGKLIWVVIDEIDEYGVHRDIAYNKTFELMRLLDGVSKNGNIRFIASTNRPNALDPALLRVGRFGPIFYVDKPTMEQKKEIINYYAKKYESNDIDLERIISEMKNGFTGCDIRSAFENCIIYGDKLTTDNIVKNISTIKKAAQYIDKSYV